MAATGVSNADVNRIMAGGVIEGKPVDAIRELREQLKKVNGKTVTITNKNGDPMTFKTGYYAKLVGSNKMREATCQARHDRLQENGIDLVSIVGRPSKNFCTKYLGNIYSLSGQSDRYPPLEGLPNNGPPFHPNCSKSTAPYIAALSGGQNRDGMTGDQRSKSIVEDIRARARAAGYEPPPNGLTRN